ncbi:MAG: hypothetical protein LBJ79_00575, partial [Endomicrobium sp.]|nr:hypothetical protein [Endomicrobium sp.]
MIKKCRVVGLVLSCLILEICSYAIVAAQEIRINGVVGHDIYGNGAAGNPPADRESSNNSVDIEGAAGVNVRGDVAGGRNQRDVVSNNRVVIDIAAWRGVVGAGIIEGDVYGGWNPSVRARGNAISNRITIRNGTISGGQGAYGGRSEGGIARRNEMEMEGGTIQLGGAYGARSYGDAISNKLKITGGTINGGQGAYGGRSDIRTAQGNEVEMEGGTITNNAYGGRGHGDAISNRMKITGGTINGRDGAYGGYSGGGKAQGNEMEMEGGVIAGDAYGGYGHWDAISNRMKITGGTINGGDGSYGGWTDGGKAQGNEMYMEGGVITNNACGGTGIVGDAISNRVKITGGTIGGGAYGGCSIVGKVEGNEVEMEGGTITNDAYGGSGQGGAIRNRMKITGGTIGRGAGGGRSEGGKAQGNEMEMEGGVITNNAYGGYGKLDANGNRVIIRGGEILANVYGGKSEDEGAVGNTVEISGDARFSTDTYI